MSQNKLEKFSFNPSEGYMNANAYPDPTNETETRTQLQSLHNQTKNFINALVDKLNSPNGADNITITIDGVQYSVQEVVQMLSNTKITGESDIKKLRINSENQTEYFNGTKWKLLGSGGHVIKGEDNIALPQTPTLRFTDSIVENNGRETVVHGIIGPQGVDGPQGPQGIQGIQGVQGRPGTSGVVAPQAGFFSLEVEPNGDLYAVYPTNETTPVFEYDSATGNLYVVVQ